jgi:hypothetical protein
VADLRLDPLGMRQPGASLLRPHNAAVLYSTLHLAPAGRGVFRRPVLFSIMFPHLSQNEVKPERPRWLEITLDPGR